MLFLAALPDPSSAAAVGWIALTIAALAGIFNQVMAAVDRFKEKPPAHLVYATKAELKEVHGRIKREREEVNAAIAELSQRMSEAAREVRDGFERLDHKRDESIKGIHDDMAQTRESLRAEIKEDAKGLRASISELLTAIGRLQGRVEK